LFDAFNALGCVGASIAHNTAPAIRRNRHACTATLQRRRQDCPGALCLSPDDLLARLQNKTGLQDLILENNRGHLISGKSYNTAGYVLQLVEYLGRKCTVGEVVAASDGELTERSVITSISKINILLYSLVGLRLTLVKDTGEIRLVNESDALMATEKFAAKFSKVRDEFVRTMDAYRATGGDVAGLLSSSDAGRKLADLSRVLAPAQEEAIA